MLRQDISTRFSNLIGFETRTTHSPVHTPPVPTPPVPTPPVPTFLLLQLLLVTGLTDVDTDLVGWSYCPLKVDPKAKVVAVRGKLPEETRAVLVCRHPHLAQTQHSVTEQMSQDKCHKLQSMHSDKHSNE